MNINLHTTRQYLKFRSEATGIKRVHSPFAYEFYKNILKDERSYYSFRPIERLRKALSENHTLLKVTELGAGSKKGTSETRSVSNIVKYASKRAKYGRLLFKIVNYFDPKYILELGTSLGLSTAYLASSRSKSKIITLEGWPEVLEIARKNFKKLGLGNIQTVEGNFDETLEKTLQDLPALDLAFIDGNHRKEATLRYFEQCLAKIHDRSILIFDDINWTKEMQEAWEEIKAYPQVTLTIDIFSMGMVFFRKEIKEKRHFKFKY